MTRKYLRKVELSLGAGGLELDEQMMIAFDVQKTISGIPNNGIVSVWNLSRSSQEKIGKEWDTLELKAGYHGIGTGIILKGDIREVYHDPQGVDTISEIVVGDGDKADRTGFIAKTFPRGTEVKDIVEEIYKNMPGVSRGEWKGLDDLPKTTRPMTFMSPTRKALDLIGKTYDLYHSIQNEALEIIPKDDAIQQVALISPETGMIGAPTITDTGVRVKTLLDADIRPNRLVEVKSKTTELNGAGKRYRVGSVAFYGDTMDGDFDAEVEGEKI